MADQNGEERLRRLFEDARGDTRALDVLCRALHEAYAERIRRFVAKQQVPAHVVDDVCQQTWEAALRGLASFREGSTFSTWLLAIALNKINDHRRSKNEKACDGISALVLRAASSGVRPSRLAAEKEKIDLINKLRRELPLEDQVLLDLHFDREMEPSEIADFLGRSPRHVRRRIADVKQELQRVLAAHLTRTG